MQRDQAENQIDNQADNRAGDRIDPTAQWDQDEQATSQQAHRLLKRRASGVHRIGDGWFGFLRSCRTRPWLRRTMVGLAVFVVVALTSFGALWWRLGAGPISFDMATPWLAAAISENIGRENSVEIGGTQIERAGRVRIAIRIRDIIVRDQNKAVIASAPKAEVKLSGKAMLLGRLRAESLNLVGAELSVQIRPDGEVAVSTGGDPVQILDEKSIVPPTGTSVANLPGITGQPQQDVTQNAVQDAAPNTAQTPAQDTTAPVEPSDSRVDSLTAALAWLDSIHLSGLDGENLNEIGLKSGRLIVDDQQRGNRFSFDNISLSLRRPSGGGVALKIGQAGAKPWSLAVGIGPPANGVRPVGIKATKVSTDTILLAMRVKGLTYRADMPLTGELRGEIGRDGVPTYFRGTMTAGAGNITDIETPDFPMHIDHGEFNLEWDSNRRALVAPFKIVSGANRVTLIAHLEPPNDQAPDWQMGLSGGTIVLGEFGDAQPLIFNRIAVNARFDNANKRVLITHADISNGEIGVAGTGSIDYAAEPRLTLGIAGTPMSALALKRMWPVLFVPELRKWVNERIQGGTVKRIDIGLNTPIANLSRKGPPLPDDGLSVNIVANDVVVLPVDDLPAVRDADLLVRVTGRTANVKISQAFAQTAGGRKISLSDVVFEVPDLAPKPSPSTIRFRADAPVPAVAEIFASDRLKNLAAISIDPNTSKGNVSARVMLGMPIQNELTEADTTYNITADLSAFSADKLVMNQKLESNSLKVTANNQALQVKGDVKINGHAGSIEYRKASDEAEADLRMQTVLDDAGRSRLGIDLGSGLSGNIPVKLSGKIGKTEADTKLGVELDLGPARIDNVLPGWAKAAGRAGKASFTLIHKPQATRLEDVVIEGSGTLIKGTLEVDAAGDINNVNFPTYSPSEGDKASLRVDGVGDGPLKVVVRGDVFDGRNFLKSAVSGREASAKSKSKTPDMDVDLKLGAIAGYYGEALRGVDVKMTWRNGALRSFSLNGKLGRDTPVTGDMRGKDGQGREVIYIETADAGAFFRFTDVYAKMYGGQMALAMEPPVADAVPREGLLNVRDFTVRGEAALDRVAGGNATGGRGGVAFSRMRAEFTRKGGQLTIREGVVKGPAVGATVEGTLDYTGNKVRMSGTFVPMYGLNNIFGQIPIVGLFLGGGSNEGLIGVTYEVVGTPGQPVLRVNPISAMAPGVLRKIFEFNTGRQNAAPEFPASSN